MMDVSSSIRLNAEYYAESYFGRALVQAIPGLGGAIDTILSGYGTQIQQQRYLALLKHIESRMQALESSVGEIVHSEELFDLVRIAVESSVKVRSEEKRRRFANLMVNAVISENPLWVEAETAMRLLNELEEIHIQLLVFSASSKSVSYADKEYLSPLSTESRKIEDPIFGRRHMEPRYICELMPGCDINLVTLACKELRAKGLFASGVDVETEPFKEHPNEYVITSIGNWLLDWIQGSDENEEAI